MNHDRTLSYFSYSKENATWMTGGSVQSFLLIGLIFQDTRASGESCEVGIPVSGRMQ